ncbi:MAG: biopolymer transporter ExbD [Treponema sp.]|jgi:biopolymer transport protein ExbD|nr:MAG: biopolymer transporter ExbD [Treponema sp.]
MMKLKERRKPDDPGDSGSLNDLSFLLIIFFLVIAGFNINKGYLMQIPEKDKPRLVHLEDLVKCELTADGAISLDGSTVTAEQLEVKIREKKGEYPNMTFFLLIEPDAPYQSVIDVVHTIRVLDVENFSFKMKEAAL